MRNAHPLMSASALAIAIASFASHVAAATPEAPRGAGSPPNRMTPDEYKWAAAGSTRQAGSSMQDAVQSVVVFGDATKPGLFSIVFKVAPGARIPAHSHPDDRSCFVTNGVWYFGYGDTYSETALRALPAGSHYTEPANVHHFAATRAEGATAQCTSIGPTSTAFAASKEESPR